jgi:hypothetical protein
MFSTWTWLILAAGLDDASDRPLLVAMTSICSISGPMTGAMCRDFQVCCLAFSLSLLPWCIAGLVFSAVTQLVLPPHRGVLAVLRFLGWISGLTVWFGGGIVSFIHALS